MITKQQVYEWCEKGGGVACSLINDKGNLDVCLVDTADHSFNEEETVEFTKQEFDSLISQFKFIEYQGG